MKLIKEILKCIIRGLGFDLVRIPKKISPHRDYYRPVSPFATYNPWDKDSMFLTVFGLIQQSTLVDIYRCFELWKLIEQVAKLKKGYVIEIGVWRGGTGALIATQAKNCGIQEKVFLCDTFTGVVKASLRDSVYKGGEHSDTSRQAVEELILFCLSWNWTQPPLR